MDGPLGHEYSGWVLKQISPMMKPAQVHVQQSATKGKPCKIQEVARFL
jgi:hypothetical protein